MTTIKGFSVSILGGVALGMAISVSAAEPAAGISLSEAEQTAVFKAAGAVRKQGMWVICADQPNPGGAVIETVRDLNGDGRLDAVVTEGGTFCYGGQEAGFQVLSKQANGSWRVITGNSGMPGFLKTKGKDGWPDISVGGPGFCFPVQRWNGKTYELNRFEYEGKRCKPQR